MPSKGEPARVLLKVAGRRVEMKRKSLEAGSVVEKSLKYQGFSKVSSHKVTILFILSCQHESYIV